MREPAGIRILVWMCVLIAVNQLGFGSIIPALALYARSFDVTQSAIGLAIAIYGLARFLVAVPAGQLADRLGRRSTLAMGSSPPLATCSARWPRTTPPSSARASWRARARPWCSPPA
jgi:MFS family permease